MHFAIPRIPATVVLAATLFQPVSLFAQTADEDTEEESVLVDYARALPDLDFVHPYKNAFSVSLRSLGRAKVKFSGHGAISTDFDEDDPTSLINRVYADGYVGLDQRGDNGGSFLTDDGMTNTWSFVNADQITADGSGVMMHAYASNPNDSFISTETGATVNPDLEYKRMLWQGGRVMSPRRRAWQVGFLAGWGLTDINAKFNGIASAHLIVTTDTYSLNGAPVPQRFDADGNLIEGYTAPSTTTIEVIGDDGITTTYVVENSTLLGNRPIERTVQTYADEAEIQGFWQVHGAYFTLRAGPWLSWEPVESLSLKVAGGGTFTLIGINMRYKEQLIINEDIESPEIGEQSETMTESFTGLFGSVDAEWLLNERTSIFASAYYEDFDEALNLEISGRKAEAEVSSGLGLRLGISTRF